MKNKVKIITAAIILIISMITIYIIVTTNNYKKEFNEKVNNIYSDAIKENSKISRENILYKIEEKENQTKIVVCSKDYYDIIEYKVGHKEVITTTYFNNNVYYTVFFTNNIRPYQTIGKLKYKANKMVETRTLIEPYAKEDIDKIKEKYNLQGYIEIK